MTSDVAVLDAMRRQIETAENAGNADGIAELFADDVVIMAPDFPVFEGREASTKFLRDLLPGVLEQFERRSTYASAEVRIMGDIAIDRGEFELTTRPRAGGVIDRVTGKYLWLYAREADGVWRCSRLIASRDEDEAAILQRRPAASDGRALALGTLVLLAIYIPLETWYSLPALWNPFYIVDLVAMCLLAWGAWQHVRRRPSGRALIWLAAGYAWSGANAWRALFGRLEMLQAGGTLRLGTPELLFVLAGTVLSIAGLAWSLWLTRSPGRHDRPA